MPVTARRGRITRRPYAVSGATLDAINRDIQRRGPVDPNEGRRYSGLCSCTIEIQLGSRDVQFETRPGSDPVEVTARVVGGTVTNNHTIIMPNLRGESALSPAARAEWRRFLDAVETHEQGHVEAYFPEAERIAQALNGLTATGTGRNETMAQRAAAQALTEQISRQYSRSQLEDIANANARAYDARTRHGASQGATLDVAIR
jgi:predicted secreted Zn-dependent protease